MDADEVAAQLGAAPGTGLTTQEALARKARFGPNRLRAQKAKSAVVILLHQFQSLIVWLLAAAAVFSVYVGDTVEAAAIVVVLVINAGIGFVTELRAARSMEALLHLAEVHTRVRRDGRVAMIDARDLVPGDSVILEAGDVITADLRVMQASNLFSDESVLTGESAPVAKTPGPVAPGAPLGDRSGMVFKGTALTQGAGEALVVATGMSTELGRISQLAQEAESEVSPLERRLAALGQKLVWLTLVLAALTVGAGLLRGHALADMIQTGVALAVAAIPEGLPVVATLSLARGMLRMARRNALISRLSSVETLGATTLILTDKTGTLTENRMTVVRYLLAEGDVRFPGVAPGLEHAVQVGALCTTAELGKDRADSAGDPMELALLEAARAAGLSPETGARVAQHAFDPTRRAMASVHREGAGFLYAVKGAPETVIAMCDSVLGPEGVSALDADGQGAWMQRNAEAAAQGLRTLALAMKQADTPDADPYAGLTLVGVVCLADPLRADVPAAIAACRAAGIRVVMVTGDHAATATRIARDAGLFDGDARVIEGAELEGLPPGDIPDPLWQQVRAADVIARVAPETKLALVATYQRDGQIVAMTGDGVNDAPALKKADIGVAMGLRGTQVAREAAHMVLRDDNFATIVDAVHQGRVIFGNIRKFVVYLMSCNLCEVLVVGLAVGAGLPAPLLPLQILFLNLVTDVFPAFALGMGRGDSQEMRRPPRDPREAIVDRAHWLWIAVLGLMQTAATLAGFGLALFHLGLPPDQAVSVAFVTLALGQLWNVFNVRSPGSGLVRNDVTRNPFVWAALAFCAGLIALAIWVPGLAVLLHLPFPGWTALALAGALSLLPLVAGQGLLSLAPARAT
ncbi:cation-translocating P-type ATPase [Maliponia aquimaris]|uniref:Calcium-transporting ATPase n=1 Tax=Maliponia aquimaris TaxID=1673631 RepID=A0A238K1Z8_9RHOB|nr:cation-transporting P-type ATPase [Maliponia aquimaris]SMX36477.1 Calcium-transporting ATPase [Maliponia aquimaris]